MANPAEKDARQGGIFALLAYGSWGVFPIFWKQLQAIPSDELLAYRIVWSSAFLGALLALWGRGGPREMVSILRKPALLGRVILASLLIGSNWYLFIYAVNSGRILESSLGYFINPLVNVAIGMVFLRERLRPRQAIAVAVAAAGVLALAFGTGAFPWIALVLALTFGFYGLARKTLPASVLAASTAETLALFPVAVAYLALGLDAGVAKVPGADGWTQFLVVMSGTVTVLPLLCFAAAARRLRLATLGFFQYIAPTVQFLLAVFIYGEVFDLLHAIAFGCIWLALGIYSVDALVARRGRRIGT